MRPAVAAGASSRTSSCAVITKLNSLGHVDQSWSAVVLNSTAGSDHVSASLLMLKSTRFATDSSITPLYHETKNVPSCRAMMGPWL